MWDVTGKVRGHVADVEFAGEALFSERRVVLRMDVGSRLPETLFDRVERVLEQEEYAVTTYETSPPAWRAKMLCVDEVDDLSALLEILEDVCDPEESLLEMTG